MQYYYLVGAALLLSSLQLLQLSAKPEHAPLRQHQVCKGYRGNTRYCDRILSRLPATAGHLDYARYIVKLARRQARRVDSLLAAASAGRSPNWLPRDCRPDSMPGSAKMEKIEADISGLPATACGPSWEVTDRVSLLMGGVVGYQVMCTEAIKSRKDLSALEADMDKGVNLYYLMNYIVEDALTRVPWKRVKSTCGDGSVATGWVGN